MNLLARRTWLFLLSSFRPRVSPVEASVFHSRVWPQDMDFNGHMNNLAYSTLMELGRQNHIVRSGLARVALRKRWLPVVSSANLQFVRSLRLFERFRVETRVVDWDDNAFYMLQRLIAAKGIAATCMVRGVVVERGGRVPMERLLAEGGWAELHPPKEPFVPVWREFTGMQQKLAMDENRALSLGLLPAARRGSGEVAAGCEQSSPADPA